MPFVLAEYVRLRPFSYHVTARENIPHLRRTLRIESSRMLLAAAARMDLLRERRKEYVDIRVDGTTVVLKDQKPLIVANTNLTDGWDFADLVEHLNCHVFFWPGNEKGPIGPGRRLLQSYADDGPAVIRIATADLLAWNPGVEPLFCPFNSGAPRYHSGRPANRGRDLFTPAAAFPRRAAEVVEMVFVDSVGLPPSASICGASGRSALE